MEIHVDVNPLAATPVRSKGLGKTVQFGDSAVKQKRVLSSIDPNTVKGGGSQDAPLKPRTPHTQRSAATPHSVRSRKALGDISNRAPDASNVVSKQQKTPRARLQRERADAAPKSAIKIFVDAPASVSKQEGKKLKAHRSEKTKPKGAVQPGAATKSLAANKPDDVPDIELSAGRTFDEEEALMRPIREKRCLEECVGEIKAGIKALKDCSGPGLTDEDPAALLKDYGEHGHPQDEFPGCGPLLDDDEFQSLMEAKDLDEILGGPAVNDDMFAL